MMDRRSPEEAVGEAEHREAERRILAERARRLAGPIPQLASATATHALLEFRRGRDRFGLSLDAVVEVHPGPPISLLPMAAPPVIGVIAWRGRVLTVIDPSSTRPDAGAVDRGWRAIIVGRSRAAVAMYADAVEDAREVASGEIQTIDDGSALTTVGIPLRGFTADALILIDGAALLERYSG